MPLSDPVFTHVGLCEIELPSYTLRLCDGGFLDWTAHGMFRSEDPTFGTIEAVSDVEERVGDQGPQGQITLLPPALAAASDLFLPAAQGSPVRFWLGEVDAATGTLVGTPDREFTGFLDTINVRVGRGTRKVDVSFVSQGERLFHTKEGNVLAPAFHTSVWPGEKGLDFATGVQLAVPWGVAGPGRGMLLGIPSSYLGALVRSRSR